jgi:hypothetical protein
MPDKRILLVEGKDDQHVCWALFQKRELPQLFEVRAHDGYSSLLEAVPVRLKESDTDALGIVVDADVDLRARWQAVRDRLSSSGYSNLPLRPEAQGLVIAAPSGSLLPRIGVWLMPNNQLPGILEDFVRFLVPPRDALFAYAQQCVDGITEKDRLFSIALRPKAIIHTWLAWQDEPGRPLGLSITTGVLKHSAPQADAFVGWIRRLFSI